MKLKPEQLKGHLSNQLLPVYLINGDEALLVQESCDEIRTFTATFQPFCNMDKQGITIFMTILIVDVFIMDDGPRRREPRGATATAQPISNVAASAATQPVNQQSPDVSAEATINPAVDNGPKTSMNFAQMAHDFGTIEQNSENEYVFEFTNTGGEPLIIQNAQGSCGCTVPEYPREPIAPGETGEIKRLSRTTSTKNSDSKLRKPFCSTVLPISGEPAFTLASTK